MKGFFSRLATKLAPSASSPAAPSREQDMLLSRVAELVKGFWSAHPEHPYVPLFAIGMNAQGGLESVIHDDGFHSDGDAISAVLFDLIPKVRTGHFMATVIAHVPRDWRELSPTEGEGLAAFDVEQLGQPRFICFLPFRKIDRNIEWGQMSFGGAQDAKLFSARTFATDGGRGLH